MRTFWNVLSILAVAHLLALLGFVGFLAGSDRLNEERIETIRDLLAVTVSAETAAREEAARLAEQEAQRAEADRPPQGNPGSEVRLQQTANSEALLQEQTLRSLQNAANIETYLNNLRAEIEQKAKDLEEARAAFRAEVARQQELQADEQFAKVLETFKGLPAEQQKAHIDELLSRGNEDFALDLLNALDKRTAQKLFGEYQTPEEITLAADLLTRLKERGVSADIP